MFLDVKELAVRKLRIRKTYAPGSIDYHSSEIKQVAALEVTATAELLEGQIRIEGQLETKIEMVCARCLEPVVEDVNRSFDLSMLPCQRAPSRRKTASRTTTPRLASLKGMASSWPMSSRTGAVGATPEGHLPK